MRELPASLPASSPQRCSRRSDVNDEGEERSSAMRQESTSSRSAGRRAGGSLGQRSARLVSAGQTNRDGRAGDRSANSRVVSHCSPWLSPCSSSSIDSDDSELSCARERGEARSREGTARPRRLRGACVRQAAVSLSCMARQVRPTAHTVVRTGRKPHTTANTSVGTSSRPRAAVVKPPTSCGCELDCCCWPLLLLLSAESANICCLRMRRTSARIRCTSAGWKCWCSSSSTLLITTAVRRGTRGANTACSAATLASAYTDGVDGIVRRQWQRCRLCARTMATAVAECWEGQRDAERESESESETETDSGRSSLAMRADSAPT